MRDHTARDDYQPNPLLPDIASLIRGTTLLLRRPLVDLDVGPKGIGDERAADPGLVHGVRPIELRVVGGRLLLKDVRLLAGDRDECGRGAHAAAHAPLAEMTASSQPGPTAPVR